MKKLLLLLVVFITANTKAQQKQLDSLLTELKKHPQEDTVRLQLLLEASYQYETINAIEGARLASTAMQLSKKMDSQNFLGRAYLYLAQNYQTLGKDSLAIVLCGQVLQIKQQMKDSLGIAALLQTIGISYQNQSDYYKAINYAQQALSVEKKLGNRNNEATVLNSLGLDYQFLGDYPKAIQYYQQAITLWEKIGHGEQTANPFTNLGLIYRYMGDYKKALQYYNQALHIHELAGAKKFIADCYGNIASVYDEQGDTTNARALYKKALQLSNEVHYENGIASASANLGISYTNNSEYSNAFAYLTSALQKFTQLNDKANKALMLTCLSNLYLQVPDKFLKLYDAFHVNRLDKAVQLQMQAIQLYKETHRLYGLNEAYENLSDIYKEQKKYADALDAYKESVRYGDSLMNNDKRQQITRLEMQYQFNKTQDSIKANTDKQQALAAAQIQKQRILKNTTMAGAGMLLLVGLGGFAFYKRNRDIRFQQQITDTEMKALRAQMNPHFIFNSLNSISDFMIKNDTQKADEYLTKFAKLMRLILENSERKEVSLTDDLKALELYMQLEALRMKNKFTYDIQVADDIDKDNTVIPPLILQPFVENSIWHGLTKKNSEGKIIIKIQKENNMLICTVEDNGIGRESAKAKEEGKSNERKSLGFKITNARIDIINRLKNTNAAITLFDLSEGTKAEVRLPLELSF